VEFQHWEIYIAAQYKHDQDQDSSTLPHLEINYGAMPNMQIHLIAPLVYVKPEGQSRSMVMEIRSWVSSFVLFRKLIISRKWEYFPWLSFPPEILIKV
jgi:hypothetical protein